MFVYKAHPPVHIKICAGGCNAVNGRKDKKGGVFISFLFSAVSYLLAGDHRRSIDHFDRLMTAHPGAVKPEWKENLAHALMAADMQRRALPHIRELAEHYSGDKQMRWQEILLYQYVKLDMRIEALAYARMLTDSDPTVAKWWKALTHIKLSDNQYEDEGGAYHPTGRAGCQPAVLCLLCQRYRFDKDKCKENCLKELFFPWVLSLPIYSGVFDDHPLSDIGPDHQMQSAMPVLLQRRLAGRRPHAPGGAGPRHIAGRSG